MAETKNPIKRLTIKGFKSLRDVNEFRLERLNVLIGANGSGKSNFVSYFRMLRELVEERLQVWIAKQGGAERILSFGSKVTPALESYIEFGLNGYKFSLEPTANDAFTFGDERLFSAGVYYGPKWTSFGAGHLESNLKAKKKELGEGSEADYCYSSISSWRVYHFHDTSDTAGVKKPGALHDNSTCARCLERLPSYICLNNTAKCTSKSETVRLAVPFLTTSC